MYPQNSTNLKNRVNKLHLSKNKPLLPLFEIISNSIHAIQDKVLQNHIHNFKGRIEVSIIRNGDTDTLKSLDDIDNYPINSFIVTDNGIGFDLENMKAFAEFDTERKAKIGGKGIGRLVCLKAFQKLIVHSVYLDHNQFKLRKFEYKKSKEGFDNYEDDLSTQEKKTLTTVELYKYEDEYQKHVPKNIFEM